MTVTRVLIAGGGFGGLEAAFTLRGLLRKPFEITLVDNNPYHTFLPSVHLILSGKVRPDEIRVPLKTILGAAGIGFIHGEVIAVDPERNSAAIAGGDAITYDYLVLCCGAESNSGSLPGAAECSHRFRSAEDAGEIRKSLPSFLRDARHSCRIIIVGAGTEGIEAAGEIVDLIEAEGLEEQYRSGRISLELIEGKNRLLPDLPGEAEIRVEEYLRGRGVLLTKGDPVAEAAKDRLLLCSGRARDSFYLIWTGGIQPSRLIRDLPFDKDPWGWLKLNDFLHVPDHDRIYAAGDAVAIYTAGGQLGVQRLASHALDQGRIAAINIAARAGNGRPVRYEPKRKPQLISLGGAMGIMATGGQVYSGPWVVSLKKAVERSHLLACLSMPVSSRLQSLMPGGWLRQRVRARLPF